MTDDLKLGGKLKELRERLGLSQEKMAEDLDVKRLTIYSYETNNTVPDARFLARLKERFDVNLDSLFTRGAELGVVEPGTKPIGYVIHLLSAVDTLGIRGVYGNRAHALSAFLPHLRREREEVAMVGSSLLGLFRVGAQDQMGREGVREALRATAKNMKVLLTHPDYSKIRERQEGRRDGAISGEIWESVHELLGLGVPEENIRFYEGTPTCFLLATGQRMLLNFYPYEAEAYTSFCLELEKAEDPGIYQQYYEHHFQRPWAGANSRTLGEVGEGEETRKTD